MLEFAVVVQELPITDQVLLRPQVQELIFISLYAAYHLLLPGIPGYLAKRAFSDAIESSIVFVLSSNSHRGERPPYLLMLGLLASHYNLLAQMSRSFTDRGSCKTAMSAALVLFVSGDVRGAIPLRRFFVWADERSQTNMTFLCLVR